MPLNVSGVYAVLPHRSSNTFRRRSNTFLGRANRGDGLGDSFPLIGCLDVVLQPAGLAQVAPNAVAVQQHAHLAQSFAHFLVLLRGPAGLDHEP
ncbi:MAG: hypothetical protein BWY63_00276 [Chloroflexi bacterium ADurb.Bin360]|nr:MAG: hypothetical protein BWY63_00276 [Chloroflexi bacterium ADurb.Bin360]